MAAVLKTIARAARGALDDSVEAATRKPVINVGLKVGDEVKLSPQQVLDEVERAGGKVSNYRIIDSSSEPTVVIELEDVIPSERLNDLSVKLDQEAIAQRFPDGTGELQGPNAAAWGEFNPEFFIEPDAPGFYPEYATSEAAPAVQRSLDRHVPTRPAASLQQIDTPANRDRITGLVKSGLTQNADRWYYTGGIKDGFVDELGLELGSEAFDQFMALKAALSPRSRVDQNLRRASIPYQSWTMDGPVDLPAEAFPPGYGHMAHNTAHLPGLRRLQETGVLGNPIDQPKTASYVENLQGNFEPVTVDTHNYQIWSGKKKSPTDNEYVGLENIQRDMAHEAGLPPAGFQSALWTGGGDITGVHNTQNLTQALNERISETARQLGVTESEAARMFMRGQTPLYSMIGAAGLGAGVLASPDEAEAARTSFVPAAIKNVNKMASKAANDAKRFAINRGLKEANQANHWSALARMEKDLHDIGNWERAGIIDAATAQKAREGITQSHIKIREGMEDAPIYSDVGTPDVDVSDVEGLPSAMLEFGEDGMNEFVPYRVQPPLSAAQRADYNENQMLSHMMSEMPQGYGLRGMEKGFNDPFLSLRTKDPTPDPGRQWTPGELEELNQGTKQTNSVAGAAGAGYVIGDDEPDPGILAEGGVREEDGRVTADRFSGSRPFDVPDWVEDLPAYVTDMFREPLGMIAGGLTAAVNAPMDAAGSLMSTGSLDDALDSYRGRRDRVRDRFGYMDDGNAAAQGVNNFFGSLMQNEWAREKFMQAMQAWQQSEEDAYQQGAGPYVIDQSAKALLEYWPL
jgi:hypothetical protein